MKTTTALATVLLATGMVSQAQAATATFLTSAPYLQFADSPFAAIASGNPNFFVEDFEDGALNTPGVTASFGTVVGVGVTVDSVDADDGLIDGNGNGGHSWYSNGATSISFSFSASALSQLPTHIGLVWTDIGNNGVGGSFGVGSFAVRAFDENGSSLGGVLFDDLGDSSVNGGTAEDRFFGAIFDAGISRITITSLDGSADWEIDHLQYGVAPVPLPGAAWMLVPALAGLVGLRRKRV